jgi:hypothetical protein
MTVVLMSRAELSRVETLLQVDRGGLPVSQAAVVCVKICKLVEAADGVGPVGNA